MTGDVLASEEAADSRFPRRHILWLVVLGITLLTHASYINNDFTWLDHIDIEQGKAIISPSQWYMAFAARYGETGFYRPLVTLTHSVDAALYGQWPPGFHLTNVLLHLGVVSSAVLFLGCFFPLKRSEALLTGLIFGVHPLSWLPVGAISYRPELLVTLLTFLAVYFHARARRSSSRTLISFAVVSVLLGLFSKETALVWIPSFILLWEIVAARPLSSGVPSQSRGHLLTGQASENATRSPGRVQLKGASLLFVGELLALGIYLFLRVRAVPEIWRVSGATLTLSQTVGTRLQVLGERLLELVSPLKPALSDATPIVSLAAFPAVLTVLVVLLGVGIVVRSGLRSERSFTVLFLAIALAPAANIIPLSRFSSPHYGYLAVLATAMLVLLVQRSLHHNIPSASRYLNVAVIAWLVVMSAVTFANGFQFRNDLTLFEPEVKREPLFLEGHFYLGNYFMQEGDDDRAAIEFEVALQNSPHVIAYVDRTAALINLAGVRFRQTRFEDAEQLLQLVAEDAPAYQMSTIAYNRALVAAQHEDHAAVVALLMERTYQWDRPEPLLLLANALRTLGRTEEAVNVLTRALPLLDPEGRRKLNSFIQTQRGY